MSIAPVFWGFDQCWWRFIVLLLMSACVVENRTISNESVIWLWSCSIQEVLRQESSLADLQRAYEAEVYARQALLAELEEQREVQKQLDGILTWVRELQAAWVKEGNGSFHESFRLVMESVKKLQEAVGEVCNKAPHWTELIFVYFCKQIAQSWHLLGDISSSKVDMKQCHSLNIQFCLSSFHLVCKSIN